MVVVISVTAGIIMYAFQQYFNSRELEELRMDAEAHANSPECRGLPVRDTTDPVQLDTEKIYTQEEIEEGAEIAMKCWKAKVRYIRAMEK